MERFRRCNRAAFSKVRPTRVASASKYLLANQGSGGLRWLHGDKPCILGGISCYAYLKNSLRVRDTPIPENDIRIAALALEHAAPLLTSDVHFDHLPQVTRVLE
jgi:hypothetical protein